MMINIKRSTRWFLVCMAALSAAAALASCAALREPCFWGCVAVDELPDEWSVTQLPRDEATSNPTRSDAMRRADERDRAVVESEIGGAE